ncbi:MAG TPA: inorganic diphosphatase [Acidimicrobiales bacterium]|nr:inorganic diphosphatase [Acidimicrobiales bacterium]
MSDDDARTNEEDAEHSGEEERETVDVLVETPKGSRKKYEYDHERGVMRLDRRLASATLFPADYGYVLETTGSDGEELDALVLADEPHGAQHVGGRSTGGSLLARDRQWPGGKDRRRPWGGSVWHEVVDIEHVPSHLKAEIESFFEVYKLLEPTHHPSSGGFEGRDAATKAIAEARSRHSDT